MKALKVGLNLGPSKHRIQSSGFIHYAMTPSDFMKNRRIFLSFFNSLIIFNFVCHFSLVVWFLALPIHTETTCTISLYPWLLTHARRKHVVWTIFSQKSNFTFHSNALAYRPGFRNVVQGHWHLRDCNRKFCNKIKRRDKCCCWFNFFHKTSLVISSLDIKENIFLYKTV